jgi:hypothetical protein
MIMCFYPHIQQLCWRVFRNLNKLEEHRTLYKTVSIEEKSPQSHYNKLYARPFLSNTWSPSFVETEPAFFMRKKELNSMEEEIHPIPFGACMNCT